MEQVMAPSWNFRTVKEEKETPDEKNSLINTITIEGLKPLSSVKTKQIIQEQLDDLKADILQRDLTQRAISGSTTAETVNKVLIPKVIKERYPDLTPEEIEEIRQRVVIDFIVKGNQLYNEKGEPIDMNGNPNEASDEESVSEGNRLLKLTNRFINIDKLSINLIDTINPFQRAYEVMSKTVDAPTLRIIQDTIAEQKFDMTPEHAAALMPAIKEYINTHSGNKPSPQDPNPQVRELGAAYTILVNLKRRHMQGLDPTDN